MDHQDIIVIGSGNAALCAAIAALEKGAKVLIIEKANEAEMGGNSRYTAGAMRFVYNGQEDILPLLKNPQDEKIAKTQFGIYPKEKFQKDLYGFNEDKPLSSHQQTLINESYATMKWLAGHNIKFNPIYSRQTFEKDGQYIFWGGLTLEAEGEGVGLVAAELAEFIRLGGEILYETAAKTLIVKNNKVIGINCITKNGEKDLFAKAIILACGGFEANPEMRREYIGTAWEHAKTRGSRHNMGIGIKMATEIGAIKHGIYSACHAVPMDLKMPNYGNLEIPYIERKHYRKICYFLGIMLNAKGERFVDEGINFRNYTYAQFGRAIIEQSGGFAWQLFDSKVADLLYTEYRFWDAHFVEADTLEELVTKLEGVDKVQAMATLKAYNEAVDKTIEFDPTILDGKRTNGLTINKTNWANTLDTPPFKAYPVTCGITFTYGGLKVDEKTGAVLRTNNTAIDGLYACGELVGGVFYHGYPGGSGLTSGAVFGRIAGYGAVSNT